MYAIRVKTDFILHFNLRTLKILKKYFNNIYSKPVNLLVLLTVVFLFILGLYAGNANSGLYINSAHGNNSTYGVKRSATDFPSDYPRGLCAHCHEQHASIGGVEPEPTGGPSLFSLFDSNHVDQTDGFCYKCHTDSGSLQSGGSLLNRGYSYRAGGWTSDTIDDILQAFSIASPGTSHNLDDIVTFITNNTTAQTWGYKTGFNPCTVCHNPHAAQGDPPNSPNGTKSVGTRGWPVSRPSQHSTDNDSWGLWGDDTVPPSATEERIKNYTLNYQAPYRWNSTITFEPDGSANQDGRDLADYITFCTDCHNNTNNITSTLLGLLNKFDWNIEKHGGGAADTTPLTGACADILDPYLTSGNCGSYVLACTDCHEPHASPNIFLIRKMVNGGLDSVAPLVTVTSGTGTGPEGKSGKEWAFLCINCHDGLLSDGYHTHPFTIPPDTDPKCSAKYCHPMFGYRNCVDCHNHGNSIIDGTPYGEQLF